MRCGQSDIYRSSYSQRCRADGSVAQDSFLDTYRDIVTPEQNEWMFEDMYSVQSLQQRQFDAGHLFYILYLRGEAVGYISLEQMEQMFIFKNYMLGALTALDWGASSSTTPVPKQRRCVGNCRLSLEVNRANRAVEFYQKMGFSVERELDTKIEGTSSCASTF